MKPRSPIARIGKRKLEKLGGRKVFSTISAPKRPVKKVNPKAKAKRVRGYRKMLAGKEYKAARAEAMKRADGRCEYVGHGHMQWLDGESIEISRRCPETEALHAHHIRYYHARRLSANDLQILCRAHHELAESRKMHKTRMF